MKEKLISFIIFKFWFPPKAPTVSKNKKSNNCFIHSYLLALKTCTACTACTSSLQRGLVQLVLIHFKSIKVGRTQTTVPTGAVGGGLPTSAVNSIVNRIVRFDDRQGGVDVWGWQTKKRAPYIY